MQAMPAFFGHERSVLVSHRASLNGEQKMSILRANRRQRCHPEPPRLTQFVRSGQAPTARTSHHLIDHPKYVWITLAFYVRSFASLRTTLQLNPRAFASLA